MFPGREYSSLQKYTRMVNVDNLPTRSFGARCARGHREKFYIQVFRIVVSSLNKRERSN